MSVFGRRKPAEPLRTKEFKPPRGGNLVSVRTANRLARVSPLDVMLDNMIFWHTKGREIYEQIEAFIVDTNDDDTRREAMALLRLYNHARSRSQRCAADAAPYVHPRYASITLVKEDDGTRIPVEIVRTMSPKEAAEVYAQTLQKLNAPE